MNFKLSLICCLLVLTHFSCVKSDLKSCKDMIVEDVQSCTQGKIVVPARNSKETCNNLKIIVDCNREAATDKCSEDEVDALKREQEKLKCNGKRWNPWVIGGIGAVFGKIFG